MKKILTLLPLLGCLLGIVTSCYDDTELRERIDKLENTTIPSVNEQINALQLSVTSLREMDASLKSAITALENTDDDHRAELDALKVKDTELSSQIATLQEQIETLRTWVQDILQNYSTTAELNERFDAVQERIDSVSSTLQGNIDSLDQWLREELSKYYTAKEIDTLFAKYSTTEEMNVQFSGVQSQIEAINALLAQMLKKLDISFDVDGSVAYSPGTTVEVNYTLKNSDENTIVECVADVGWKATVEKTSSTTGKISVTTPTFGGEGKVLVFANKDDRTAMRVLRFEQGTLTVLTDVTAVEPEDTILTIDARTNVEFRVVIPAEAQSWIELQSIDTRATMRTDVITLSIKLNATNKSRSAVITLVDTHDKELSSFTIFQRADVQAANEIWYTSVDGNVVEPSNPHGFGGINIVSNTCVKGKGIIAFDGDITTVGNRAFQYGLLTLSLPEGVTSIGDKAFASCGSLTSVSIPNSVTSIGYYAFYDCSSLTSVTIPESITSIDYSAFNGCRSLTSVAIPNSMTAINKTVFELCTSLTSVTIPNSVTSIGDGAFDRCWSLTSINIPESVTSIGNYAFWDCTSLTSITIPESVTNIGERAFDGCKDLTSVVCLQTTPLDISIDVFSNDVTDYCTLYVPAGSVIAYSVAKGWQNFKEILPIE